MSHHFRTGAAPLVFAIALLLMPMLYVGSYLSLVQPKGQRIYDPSGPLRVAHYRIDHHLASKVYYPLEKIDRKVRPKEWSQPKILYML